MGRIGYTLALLLLLAGATTAQTSWMAHTPDALKQQPLTGVACPDSMSIVVATSYGVILRSADRGATWANAPIAGLTGKAFLAISFADARHGMAAGALGNTARSSDGGATWTATPMSRTGATMWFRAVANPVPSIAVVAGDSGIIMTTRDAGDTWTRASSPVTARLYGISFPDTTVGYCCGAGGTILKSTDLGRSWVAQASSTARDLRAIHFTDRAHGYAVADWLVVKTTDGGTTWTPETGSGQAIFFRDSATGFAGSANTIIRTENSARSWSTVSSEAAAVDAGSGVVQAIAFGSNTFGAAVGDRGLVLLSTDGGRVWRLRSGPLQGFRPKGMQFPAVDRGYFVSYDSRVWRTDDSGTSWRRCPTVISSELVGASFQSRDSGWAIGMDGSAIHTADGGENWSVVRLPTFSTAAMTGIAFRDRSNGFVVGTTGEILRTRDGGATWSQQWSGCMTALRAVAWADHSCIVVAGDSGVLLRSTDEGERWQRVPIPMTRDIRSLSFIDAFTAYAAGAQGLCLRSTDAGASWHRLALPGDTTKYTGYAVAFADKEWGLFGGYGTATALETSDGAASWHEPGLWPFGMQPRLMRSACFPDPLHAVFALDDMQLFRAARPRAAGARISASSAAVGFGRATAGAVQQRALWIANTGDTVMAAPALSIIGPDAPEFRIVSFDRVPLPATASKHALLIEWRAGPAAAKSAVLRIEAPEASPSSVEIPLAAQSVQPLWTANATRMQYGDVGVGESVERTLVLTSQSSGPLPAPRPDLTGADASQFAIVGVTPDTIAPGGAAVVTVRCTPTREGRTVMAWLRFPESDIVAPLSTVSLEATGAVPKISTNKATVEFGMLVPGVYKLDSLVFTNTGTVPLRLFEQSITGTDSDVFRILEAASATIAPGRSSRVLLGCSTAIFERPVAQVDSTIAGGNDTPSRIRTYLHAFLHVRCNTAGTKVFDYQLNGGVIERGVRISPVAVSYDSTALLSMRSTSMNVENLSGVPQNFISLRVEGPDSADFTSTPPGNFWLRPHSTELAVIDFRPRSEGRKQASVRYTFADVRQYDIVVPLTGVAGAFPLEFRPSTVLFDTTRGSERSQAEFWIHNISTTPQRIGKFNGASGRYNSFSFSAPSQSLLAPGDSARVTATFRPGWPGWNTATYWIYLGNGGAFHADLNLRGFVIDYPWAADHPAMPLGILGSPYPQPAADAAVIPFSLAASSHVTLAVHDALGRRVALLADSDLPPGEHTRSLDTRALTPGVYLAVLELGNSMRLTKTLVVLR
ncbi:MAG: choice-of-anchor D domain-containing protein [Ignavibacteria bacterium]|nr:choice-of-anchor D domain-containing protein [Ignavibacteria bacterium]